MNLCTTEIGSFLCCTYSGIFKNIFFYYSFLHGFVIGEKYQVYPKSLSTACNTESRAFSHKETIVGLKPQAEKATSFISSSNP